MSEITRGFIVRVGVDLAKRVIQVHAVDANGRVVRGLPAEFGLVLPQSPKALRQVLPAVLEDASNEMGGVARPALQRAQKQWEERDDHMS